MLSALAGVWDKEALFLQMFEEVKLRSFPTPNTKGVDYCSIAIPSISGEDGSNR